MEKITWQTEEYEHYIRGADWFWTVGIVGGAGAVISILFGNILLAIIFIIAIIVIFQVANKPPQILECEISDKGVRVNDTLYPFTTLEAFSIEEGYKDKLHLKSKKLLMPLITIFLEGSDSRQIKDFLETKLPEHELTEPLSQKIMEYFGF